MSKDEDIKIQFSDQVREQMAENPDIAKAIKEFAAALHQAVDSVKRGQYKTVDDALEALLGSRPVAIDPDTGEVAHGVLLNDQIKSDRFSVTDAEFIPTKKH